MEASEGPYSTLVVALRLWETKCSTYNSRGVGVEIVPVTFPAVTSIL